MMLLHMRAWPAERAVTGCNREGGISQGSAVDFGMIPNRTMLLNVERARLGRVVARLSRGPDYAASATMAYGRDNRRTEAFVSRRQRAGHSHLYFEDEPATKQLNKDEPRRIACQHRKNTRAHTRWATSLLPCR